MTSRPSVREVQALKVHQWLKDWEKVEFDERARRRRPDPYFYLFTLPAAELKALSGIARRTTEGGLRRAEDPGIQRRHDEERSKLIGEFVRYGFPWSELSEAKRKSGRYDDLRKPGWLPTAIVVNILKPGDKRRGREVNKKDIIDVTDGGNGLARVRLPSSFTDADWEPTGIHPLEVIDGQHRLWAVEPGREMEDFHLPVVAFQGLDISWQAYLFWTINLTPKRINRSLAYDLYPLLRTEDWLERFEGHPVYRETRSQELTESLWAYPTSPWHERINMLGERGLEAPMVSQAAWIRSLMATYVKAWEGRRITIGGLFGTRLGRDEEVLPWSRAQQAAFLIFAGQAIRDRVKECKKPWAASLREAARDGDTNDFDPAFFGAQSLLSTDQGIRGILSVTNDLCYVLADEFRLREWVTEDSAAASDLDSVEEALLSFKDQPAAKFIGQIAASLATYDWRTSSAPGLTDEQQLGKAAFRGSGGYKEIRRALLIHLSSAPSKEVSGAASSVLGALGY